MLSRDAENIYWMTRYVERTENLSRLINVNSNLLLDLPRGIRIDWESLLFITDSHKLFYHQYKEPDERSVIRFLLANEKNPGSIISSLAMAKENFRATRDIVPTAAAENINNLYLFAKENLANGITRKGRFRFLRRIIDVSQMNTGLLDGTMLHDHAFCFVKLARNIERADMTTRILDVRSKNPISVSDKLTPFRNIQWMSILKSLTAYEGYRRCAHSRVNGRTVLKFVLHNPAFPRSVVHCLHQIEACLESLPRCDSAIDATEHLKSALLNIDLDQMASAELPVLMDKLQLNIAEIHNQIQSTYFFSTAYTNGPFPDQDKKVKPAQRQRQAG